MKNVFIVVIILTNLFFVNNAISQPPEEITKVDYVNYSPEEIPVTETFWSETFFDWFYDDYIIETQSSYCNNELQSNGYCTGGWSNWQRGVYQVKEVNTGCEIRVEYRWRYCLSDWNIVQHQIVSLFFETSDWPWNTDCDDLQDWINADMSGRLHYLFEDMYQKIGLEAFKANNELVKQQTGHPIYCDDPYGNHPTKVHHINGSCENYCYCTKNIDGKVYTVVYKKNCIENFCCIITEEYCVDRTSNKIKWNTQTSYSTPGADSACQSAVITNPDCFGETCYRTTNCVFKCGDSYLVHDYDHAMWTDYPFRDIYADILDPMYFPEPPQLSTNVELNVQNEKLISVIPNPAKDYLSISVDKNTNILNEVIIYDVNGKIISSILSSTIKGNSFSLNTSKYSEGAYFIVINCENTKIIKKFIIQR